MKPPQNCVYAYIKIYYENHTDNTFNKLRAACALKTYEQKRSQSVKCCLFATNSKKWNLHDLMMDDDDHSVYT